jgi:hypothetical protein
MARKKPQPQPLPRLDLSQVSPEDAMRSLALLGGLGVPPRKAPRHEDSSQLSPAQAKLLRRLLAEAAQRQTEALRIYRPLAAQSPFFESRSRIRLLRGSNRAGKTLTACVEVACQALKRDPFLKYAHHENPRIIVVGRDLDHIGQVQWRKLSRAGAFQITRDPETGQWRQFFPRTDPQLGLKGRPCPPLIPPRSIRSIAWENKKASQPKKVLLVTGTEMSFYSSKGEPPQGLDATGAWFDEEIVQPDWLPETVARLIDHMGWLLWSATPQAGTQQLFDLHERAEEMAAAGDPDPLVAEFFLSIHDNVFLTEKAISDFIDSLDEDERRVRVGGEFAITGTKIFEGRFYPNGVHGVPAFEIPRSWTRFAAIDPGAQVGTVLFCAVPPSLPDGEAPDELYGDFMYVYDEIYIRGCDAQKLAERVRDVVGDQEIATFLIDHHGGRLTEIGSGKTPEQQYIAALRAAAVPFFAAGGHFTYGSDDLDGGILRVKSLLRVREDGTSKIRILQGRAPNLCREMKRYSWKIQGKIVTDKPVKKDDHTVDCLRYLCMYSGLSWRKPKSAPQRVRGAYEAFREVRRKMAQRRAAEHGTGVTLA